MDTSNQRPDLLAPIRGAAESGTRILAMLEYGNRMPGKMNQVQRWHLDGWTAGMGVAVLVLAALAWMSREAAIRAEPGRPFAGSGRLGSTGAPPSPGLSTRSSAKASAPASAPQQEPSAATIVSLPEPPQSTLARPATASRTTAPVSLAAQTTLVATSPRLAASSPPTLSIAKPAIPATSRSAAATINASPRDAAGGRAGAAPTVATKAAASSDTDVALLAALVAHAGTPASVAPERSRDVVLPQEGEGTTLLLARCKQLGLIEGMLCRSRICSGRWENDPACRAPSH